MADEPLSIVVRGKEHVLAGSPRLYVSVHDGPTTLASVAAESHYARTKLGKVPRSVGCLVILGEHTPPPEPEVRSALPKLLDEIAPACAGFAMVVEGAGFRAAALRAIFSGFLVFKRLPYKTAVFDSPLLALRWLGSLVDIDPESRAAQIERLRAP